MLVRSLLDSPKMAKQVIPPLPTPSKDQFEGKGHNLENFPSKAEGIDACFSNSVTK